VPGDSSQWDLVDAGGICVRGFPRISPESSRLPGTEPGSMTRAAGYATRSSSTVVEDVPTPSTLMPSPGRHGSPGSRPHNAVRRAAGYAIKPRSSR